MGELQRAAAELGEDALLPAEVRTGALRTRVASAGRELEACRLRRAERARAADALDGEASALSAQLGEARVETRGTVREHAPLSGEALRLLDAEVRALRAEHASRESEWRRHRDAIVHLRAALAGEAAPLAVRGETPDLRLRTLVALRAELASLDELRRQRAGAIASIRARVSGICAQLGLQLDEATARAAATDVSELAVQGWRSELERLEKLRRASLARLVDEARAEVLALWAALGISLSAVRAPRARAAPNDPSACCPCSRPRARVRHARRYACRASVARERALPLARVGPLVPPRARRSTPSSLPRRRRRPL